MNGMRRSWLGFGVVLACSPAAPPTAQTLTPAPSERAAVAPPPPPLTADAGPPKPPSKTSQCKPLEPNEVSDDDHPEIAGVGSVDDTTTALDWLGKRGVSEKAASAWYAARFGGKAEEARVGEMYCHLAKVGDPSEEALVCSVLQIQELMPRRLVGIVVRNKQPVAVFQVGLMLGAMDFPEAHHLDLAFRLAPDGKSFDLTDRAPDGSVLVMSPSECLAREQRGEGLMPDHMGLPATLHDCAGSKKVIAEMAANAKGDPRFRQVVQSGGAFATKACADRGHYVWTKDRFVKGP